MSFDDTQQREVAFANPGDAAVFLPAAAEQSAEHGEALGSAGSDLRSSGSHSSEDAGDSGGSGSGVSGGGSGGSGDSGGSPPRAAARAAWPPAGQERARDGQLMLRPLAKSSPSERLRYLIGCIKRLLPQAK